MLKIGLIVVLAVPLFSAAVFAAENPAKPAQVPPAMQTAGPAKIRAASDEGEKALKTFKVAPGLKADLWAAEPLLANPVAIAPDEHGRWYVVESFRFSEGVADIRGHMNWLEAELASTNLAMWRAIITNDTKYYTPQNAAKWALNSERIRLISDSTGSGQADQSTVFSQGYSDILDGIASGVLPRKGHVWFTSIPDLWFLRDTNGDGVADEKRSLARGFGIRTAFLGHDLHGLIFGPDGKLYFSVGDRGANATSAKDGSNVLNPEYGCVYRCHPDGSELEIVHRGLRNPQSLAFDQFGNLWTGDNNSDGGDPARWVYLLEGGDSGWRIGWQFINSPNSRGPWMSERLCFPAWEGQAAYHLPPVAVLGNGPSGLAFNPGTGLPEKFANHFFLANYSGSPGASGILNVSVTPKGAGFALTEHEKLIWNICATDVKFGVDGGVYVADWVTGWSMLGKGRLYRVHDPLLASDPTVLATKKIIGEGMTKRSVQELAALLAHRDQRIRQEAQFELADRAELSTFAAVAAKNGSLLARLHAVWGLGQLTAKNKKAVDTLLPLLADEDAEVRAQAAKVLGNAKADQAFGGLVKLLADSSPRVRSLAAIAVGKLHRKEVVPALFAVLKENADKDPVLRHAAVIGLEASGDVNAIIAAGQDADRSVRLGALLALRRLKNSAVALFLKDADPLLVADAARAINDESINDAMPQLAALLQDADKLSALSAGTKDKPGPRDAVIRRVLNANLRLGTPAAASALAQFAAFDGAPETRRVEALQHLTDWAKPGNLDRVSGLYRPVPPREAKIAAEAARPVVGALVRNSPPAVRTAATKLVDKLGIKDATIDLFAVVANAQADGESRAAALKSLAGRNDPRLAEAVKLALAAANETLRKEAARVSASSQPGNASGQLSGILEKGTVSEKQNAIATLGALKDGSGDPVLGALLAKLLAKTLPPELQLDVLEAAARRATPAFKTQLEKFEAARDAKDDLAAFRECLNGGDAQEGQKVFAEKVEASCIRCHKVGDEGGEVGPNLTGIGQRKDRVYILESLVLPNKQIAPGFDSVIVTLKSGLSYAGILKSETADVLEINSPEDGLLKVKTADIKSRDKGLSGMVDNLGQVLTRQDLRNLVEFLGTSK